MHLEVPSHLIRVRVDVAFSYTKAPSHDILYHTINSQRRFIRCTTVKKSCITWLGIEMMKTVKLA